MTRGAMLRIDLGSEGDLDGVARVGPGIVAAGRAGVAAGCEQDEPDRGRVTDKPA